MTIERMIEQGAAEGSGAHAIAYALLQVAKAIEGAGESLALAIDGVTDELHGPEITHGPEVTGDVNAATAYLHSRGLDTRS